MRPYAKKMVTKTFAKKDKKNKGQTIQYTESHREWPIDEAKDFVNYVDHHDGAKRGLTYWSARDFLDHKSK